MKISYKIRHPIRSIKSKTFFFSYNSKQRWDYCKSIGRSFFRFIKINKLLRNAVIIPLLSLIDLLLYLWLFFFKGNSFFNNLIVALFTTLMTVTYITFIQKKEHEKKFKKDKNDLIELIEREIDDFIQFCFLDYLKRDEQDIEEFGEKINYEIIQLPHPPGCSLGSKSKYIKKEKAVFSLFEKFFDKANLTNAKEFKERRISFLKFFGEIRENLKYLEFVDCDVLEKIEKIADCYYPDYKDEKPSEDRRHQGCWLSELYLDMTKLIKDSIDLLKAINDWEEDSI